MYYLRVNFSKFKNNNWAIYRDLTPEEVTELSVNTWGSAMQLKPLRMVLHSPHLRKLHVGHTLYFTSHFVSKLRSFEIEDIPLLLPECPDGFSILLKKGFKC